ncbi:MAG: DNA replication and repair protein RecF, partial [Erysipelotrichaceae bacterium]|nr:DNA replication and repair protein RecF [Erysipelotrichaceae bacterium]
MLIRSVRLNDYRNYVRGVFTFDPHLNIIIGKNGTGKTNLLESIVVVSNTKSYRTNDDRDLIRKGREFARIELNSDENEFRVVINKKGKSLFIDGTLIRKTSDFIGRINAVLFKPSDLELFTQSPGERRKLLDIEISKVSRRYIDALLKYNRLLKDKNRLLKENEPDEVLMSVINESMVPLIKTIIEEREGFFEVINEYISPMYAMISGKEVKIEIRYRSCSAIDEVEKKIEQTREKDFYYHYATYGTHHE